MTRPGRSSPLEQIPAVLPALIADVSLGRTQLIVDQLRGALQRGGAGEIVMIMLPRESDSSEGSGGSAGSEADQPVAVALALTQPPSDAATLLHAGLIADEVDLETERRLAEQLRRRLRQELGRRGVRFVQWATDPVAANDVPPTDAREPAAENAEESDREKSSVVRWAEWLGLQPVATLRYMTASLPALSERLPSDPPREKRVLDLVPVDRGDPASFHRFCRLVHRTYRETLDCEPLSQMRSAEQILSAYHHSRAFQDQWWYRVVLPGADGTLGEAVGCLVLAVHRGEDDSPPPEQPAAGSVMELVYMGLVPEVRGRGLGRQLVAETVHRAGRWGAERLILAVDERNRPAIDAYSAAGFAPLLRETVWAANVPAHDS